MSPESYLFIAKLLKIVIIVLSVVAAGLFCVPFYLSTKESRIRKKKLKQLYASRKSLDDDEFYKRFYESRNVPRDIVEKVRKILAEDFYLLDVSRILRKTTSLATCQFCGASGVGLMALKQSRWSRGLKKSLMLRSAILREPL